jgi:hypothetical protein
MKITGFCSVELVKLVICFKHFDMDRRTLRICAMDP